MTSPPRTSAAIRRRQLAYRQNLERRGIRSRAVLDVMERVRRDLFVPEDLRHRAWDDCALPISSGQTISQPYVVGWMTELLDLTGNENVLEIGTGTGYQTAILAELARHVVTIERIPELAATARARLEALGYRNIAFHTGDGTRGWPPGAPYAAILVAAGTPAVPQPLYEQLADDGRLVIPVGDSEHQRMQLIRKTAEGPEVVEQGGCVFVPLISDPEPPLPDTYPIQNS